MALLDGSDLAECLCTHSSTEKAIDEYDNRSLLRARMLLRNSHLTVAVAHASGWKWFLIQLLLQSLSTMDSAENLEALRTSSTENATLLDLWSRLPGEVKNQIYDLLLADLPLV
ncbi:hypothetical protein EJ08DRAFT_700376 [Tothia fuscella]|uniref:Uncharacterized protein n=1 Tax=Tothia fuscella TaxID=1048955 RepID=A0A9P4NKU0_9PEZI|nr:hypothetical protein EJ08DRAFT_700376 [Tothia fuscella]